MDYATWYDTFISGDTLTKAKCVECHRVFNLLDEKDAEEWGYGHDCEAV